MRSYCIFVYILCSCVTKFLAGKIIEPICTISKAIDQWYLQHIESKQTCDKEFKRSKRKEDSFEQQSSFQGGQLEPKLPTKTLEDFHNVLQIKPQDIQKVEFLYIFEDMHKIYNKKSNN